MLGKIKNKLAKRFLNEYQKKTPFENCCFGQEGEDLILERFFNKANSGFYVDVGALHPQRFSNTLLFYLNGWSGINIEPNPDAIELFKIHRSRDINLNCGVGKKEGILTYYCFNEPALNTFSTKLKEDYSVIPGYLVTKQIDLALYSLESILDMHLKINKTIDFMSVDVEGLDLDVLESNNWTRYRPKVVLVEDLSFNDYPVLASPICQFMQSVNYQFFAKTINTVFFKDKNLG